MTDSDASEILWRCEGFFSCSRPAEHNASWVNFYRGPHEDSEARFASLCAQAAEVWWAFPKRPSILSYDYYLPIIQPDIAAEVTTGIEAFCHAIARWPTD